MTHFVQQLKQTAVPHISFTPNLTVPVTLDEDIVGNKKFNLIANLARGHYTSFIKSASASWFHCVDAAFIPSNKTALNNGTSYVFSTKMCLENMKN